MRPELRNTRRIAIRQLLGSAAALAALRAGQAADGKRPPRIGFMTGAGFPELEAAFTDELRKLGVVEGRDVLIERRFTRPNTNDSQTMSAELAGLDLAFIVVSALPLALNGARCESTHADDHRHLPRHGQQRLRSRRSSARAASTPASTSCRPA